MFGSILLVIICLFISLLFVNFYFRLKILKLYKKLKDKQIEFPASYILKPQKLKNEIVPLYPGSEHDILGFSKHMRFSLGVALAVFVICCFIGFIYINNR